METHLQRTTILALLFAVSSDRVRPGRLRLRRTTILALLFVACTVSCPNAAAENGGGPALPVIEAGTLVDDPNAARWNRVVLLARPRISSGDVEALPIGIRDAVTTFVLTILANVRPEETSAGAPPRYQLDEIGLGYSAMIEDRLTVVSGEEADRLGVRLGFFQRQVLGENYKQLRKVQPIVRTSTLVIFDVPSVMLHDGKHLELVTRHFIWIDPRSGRIAMLVWLLERQDEMQARVYDLPMRYVPPGAKEDRAIHVDADEFSFLGIPSDRAFALEDLPPGKSIAWTEATRRLAAQREYDTTSLQQLAAVMNLALQASRSEPTSSP